MRRAVLVAPDVLASLTTTALAVVPSEPVAPAVTLSWSVPLRTVVVPV